MAHRPHYYDGWDQIVTDFVVSREPFKGYWLQSEQYALTMVDNQFVTASSHKRMLDLGCGTGRLLPRYASRFKEVVAIEPDAERFRQAVSICRAHDLRNVTLINCYFEDYESGNESFDLVLCGHVVQHLTGDCVSSMLKEIRFSLADGGILILLTAFSHAENDRYLMWSIDVGHSVAETEIQEHQFNQLLLEGTEHAYLPSRAFGRVSIRKLFSEFKLRQIHYFHALHKQNWLDWLLFRDCWINWPLIRGNYGVDVLLVLEKT